LAAQSPVVKLLLGLHSWQITAINAVGNTKSASFVFSTIKPSKPQLVAPVGGITINNPTPALVFTITEGQNLTNLKITVTQSGVTTPVIDQTITDLNTICVGATCSFLVTTPLANSTFAWAVQVKNANGNNKSVNGSFKIAYPDKPTGLNPNSNIAVNTQKPVLAWSQVPNANEYRVTITHSSGTKVVLGWAASGAAGLTCDGTACSLNMALFTAAPNLKKGAHKWFVEARNTGVITASTSKSAQASFKVVLPVRRDNTEGEILSLPPSEFRAP
jgi:hypothetical protein